MQNFRTASVRLDAETWAEVERRARKERRPVGNLLRIIVTDAIAPPLPRVGRPRPFDEQLRRTRSLSRHPA
jgi:hypothetical protein